MRLNLVYYGKHDPETDLRITRLAPDFVIVNTPHGLWGEVRGGDTSLCLQDIGNYQTAGIKVIGYLTGGYEGTGSGGRLGPEWYSLNFNRRIIRAMAVHDHADGVFIDECNAYPDRLSKVYLRELAALAHEHGLTTWGNVGKENFDEWFLTEGGFDLIQSTEDWHGQKLSAVQSRWGKRITVTGFRPAYTVDDAVRLTRDAWRKELAYCYINHADYATLPDWIEEYARLLDEGHG